MKIRNLVKELKKCGDERIPMIAVDKFGRKYHLGWGFSDDGPDWAEFSFHILDGHFRILDTDAAKAILEYAYSDPDRNEMLFGYGTRFLDYALKVSWPVNRDFHSGGCWCSRKVESFETKYVDDRKTMVFYVEEDLPDWNDKNANQEEDESDFEMVNHTNDRSLFLNRVEDAIENASEYMTNENKDEVKGGDANAIKE